MFALISDELEAQLADPQARKRWLILDQHPDFFGHWIVEGFDEEFLFDVGEIIGSYRALAPSGLERFLGLCDELEYRVAFFEDPTHTLRQFEHLNAVPDAMIDSTFENTVNGMLPFQVQGYNMLKDLEYGVARWDTGTGKTVLASALVQHHEAQGTFDLCFCVVKKNNKVNTVRKLERLADVDAIPISGPRVRREKLYAHVKELIQSGGRPTVVLNYEQFKDFVHRPKKKGPLELNAWGEAFFPGRDLLFIWDEMPTKLKTRTSGVYKSICRCLYRTDPPKVSYAQQRPRVMRSYMLSATPIENSPQDWFNCIRLMDGGRTYGTVTEFDNTYVASWNAYDPDKPATFHNFERMRLKTASFVHQVTKNDPAIAAVFPKVIEELVYIDWDEKNAALYNDIQAIAAQAIEDVNIEDIPIFSLIGTLQMICDAPEMVRDSAARREIYEDARMAWEENPQGREPGVDGSEFALKLPDALRARLSNTAHPKLGALREILLERHPEAQVAIYSKLNKTLMPYLEAALREWKISYGRYEGTERQKQSVQDRFQAGETRIFLASDSGSDSIDLDAGNVVIDYNLPWKWTVLTQRHNRVHRPTSTHATVYYYSLIMAGSVEERVLEIIETKHGYHNELFDPAAGDISASARLTKQELLYILDGRERV